MKGRQAKQSHPGLGSTQTSAMDVRDEGYTFLKGRNFSLDTMTMMSKVFFRQAGGKRDQLPTV